MTTIREDAAQAFVDAMKARSRYEPDLRFTYALPGHRQVGVTWHPDTNYGRLHEPPQGMEGWAYRWSYYTAGEDSRQVRWASARR